MAFWLTLSAFPSPSVILFCTLAVRLAPSLLVSLCVSPSGTSCPDLSILGQGPSQGPDLYPSLHSREGKGSWCVPAWRSLRTETVLSSSASPASNQGRAGMLVKRRMEGRKEGTNQRKGERGCCGNKVVFLTVTWEAQGWAVQGTGAGYGAHGAGSPGGREEEGLNWAPYSRPLCQQGRAAASIWLG